MVATSNPLLTLERRSRMVTSEGPIPLGDISPRCRRQLQDRDFDTRGAKSTAVLDKLYPGKRIKKSTGPGQVHGRVQRQAGDGEARCALRRAQALRKKKKRGANEEARLKALNRRLRRHYALK